MLFISFFLSINLHMVPSFVNVGDSNERRISFSRTREYSRILNYAPCVEGNETSVKRPRSRSRDAADGDILLELIKW